MSSGTVPIIIGGVAGFAALIGLIVVCYRHYSKSQKVLPLEQLPPTSSPALASSEQALPNPEVSRSTPEQCPPATEPVQETIRDPITPPIVNDLIPSATSMPTTNASIDHGTLSTAELIQSEALEPLTNESSPTPTQPPPRPQSNLLINYDMRTMPAGTRYHTISHVWDKVSLLPDPYKQTGVLLTSHEKQAAVARIAEAAGVPVWMDVYSIDQENEEFKNAQVSIMYNVYNNAEKCHVLLTPTDAEMFKRVIQVLRGLASPQFPDLLCNMDDDPLMNLHHPFSFAYAAVGTEIGVLYNRRVWTLQEVHASKGVAYYDAEGVEVVDGEEVLEMVGRVVAGAMLFRMRVDAGHPVVQGLVYSSRVSGGRFKGRVDGVLRFAWNVLRAYVPGRREEVVGKLEGCGFREALGGFADTFFDLIAANFEPMVRLSVGFRVASVKHDYVYGIAGMVGLDVPVDYGMDVGELVLIARRGLFVKGLLRIEVAAAEPTWTHYLMANVDVEQNPWWNPKWTKVQRLWTREFPAPVLVDRTHGVDKSHTVSVKAVSAPVTISEDDVNFMAPDILDQEMHSLGGGSQNQNFIVASGLMSQVMHKSTIRDLKCLSYIRNEVLQSLCDPANESILNSVYLVVGTLTLVSGLSEQVVFVYPETTRKYFENQCRLHLVAFLDQVILCTEESETEKAEGLSVRPLCYVFPITIGSSPLDLLTRIEPVDVTIL